MIDDLLNTKILMVNHEMEMKYTLTLTARSNSREINMNKLKQCGTLDLMLYRMQIQMVRSNFCWVTF